jgi:lysophospholipase L1-like esterase
MTRALIPAVCFALFGAMVAPGIAQTSSYLSLGDSLAFGFDTPSTTPFFGSGDRGYVALYANHLATKTGQRPRVVNLGVPAETTQTFFGGGSIGTIYNGAYPLFSPPTQASLMESRITDEINAGRSIDTVSLHIGVNDFLDITETAGFDALSLGEQQSLIDAALPAVATRYEEVLTRIRARLPAADLIVLGYYNPFAAVPSDPLHAIAPYGAQAVNAMIEARAAGFGGRYIDVYTPFLGHEAEWTLIVSDGDIHPNAAGYAVIADLMIPASCLCELTGDETVDVFDLLAYLNGWFMGAAAADIDGQAGVDVFDLLAYLDCWFVASAGAPCP